MPKQVTVSALEHEGLLNLEKVIRAALKNPNLGEFIAGALFALEAVRREEAGDLAAPQISGASTLATALIERAKKQ